MNFIVKIIKHKTKLYWQSIELRDKILRKPLGLEFTKEELDLEYNQIHFVGFIDNEIVANLSLVPKENGSIKMRQVCVKNSFQKKGLGKEIVQFSEKWAQENKYTHIFCHARKSALNFYLKLEYKIEGEKFIEVGLEHNLLAKTLR